MPESTATPASLAQQIYRLNPSLQEVSRFIQKELSPKFTNQLNPVLEQINRDIQRIILSAQWTTPLQNSLDAQMHQFQREAARITADIARRIASEGGGANGMGGGPGVNEIAEAEDDGADEQRLLSTAARAAEDALETDPKMRKRITRSATRISQWTTMTVADARNLLLGLLWISMVVLPWTDGEVGLDDYASPAAASLTVAIATIDGRNAYQKNLLSKNGPQQRRHRRKRRR